MNGEPSSLATALDRPWRDSDADLAILFGATGAELAAEHGVDALHAMESAVLLGALAAEVPSVISAAGWVVEDPWCRGALARRAVTIVLAASTDRLAERIATGSHRRAIDRAELAVQQDRRGPLFAEVAEAVVDAEPPAELVVRAVLEHLGEPGPIG